MIEHYNAFISYRHAELDSAVAAEVQTRLERFRIPKAIRKKCGIQKINRIFRDKEELLITSDLNETIEQALSHSDFLIVICSHSTKESAWVQKEIEFFLKTHPRNKVLTVVAEGEPADVVPQILRQQQVTVTLESGQEQVVTVPVEPLSCDYRGSFSKARKEELPRLAAAILGCSYDELKQRQRQYRTRRITLALSVAALLLSALAVYYAWSANQIHQNYIQALRNESQFLSRESLSLLEEGDRLEAIRTALNALPKDEKDERPVLPEAEFALSQAVNAYWGPDSDTYCADKAFSHGGTIDSFFVTEDQSRMVVLHSENTVTIWDVKNRTRLSEKVFASSLCGGCLTSDGGVLLLTQNGLFCYDLQTAAVRWEKPYEKQSYSSYEAAAAESSPVAAFKDGDELLILSTTDGSVLQKAPMPTYSYENAFSGEETLSPYDIHVLRFSPDGKTLFLHLNGSEDDPLAFFDLTAGEFTVTSLDFFLLYNAAFSPDGNLIFTGDYTLRMNNYQSFGVYQYDNGYLDVACMTPVGEVLWADGIDYAQFSVGIDGDILFLECPDSDGTPVPAVACNQGETIKIFRLDTGEALQEITCPAVVAELTLWDGYLSAVLSDGSLCNYWLSSDDLYAISCCIQGIDMAVDLDTLYVSNSQTGNILQYTYGLHDERWTPLETTGTPLNGWTWTSQDAAGHTTLLHSGMYDQEPFGIIDGRTRTLTCWDIFPEEISEEWSFLQMDSTGERLLFSLYVPEDSTTKIGAYHLKEKTFDPNWMTLTSAFSSNTLLLLEKGVCYQSVYLSLEDYEISHGFVLQGADGSTTDFPFTPVEKDVYFSDRMASPSENYILFKDNLRYFYTLDLQTGAVCHTDPIAMEDVHPVWAQNSDIFFVNDENCIRAFDAGCRELYTIPCEGKVPGSLFAAQDMLYVLYGTESLASYRVSDGTAIAQVKLDLGKTLSGKTDWNIHENILAVRNYQLLYLLDAQTLTVRAKVPDFCLGYDLEEGLIYVDSESAADTYRIGYYEIYDYLQLIEIGKEQLQ